ncbi:hypothetical protein SOCE26_033670 [Sorangium cellulosum]|uniref:Uncharacterized protein n=1 Tax=Sorangium cellulosum TaxID=56 RepID=A0A2L0ERQ5_SORCE|nr:DUF1592 domain-containing protein [Sorangium cellulosum]AUX41942.1 hypothetical protein SOCE26_033670 [Sorangium cellulosum]
MEHAAGRTPAAKRGPGGVITIALVLGAAVGACKPEDAAQTSREEPRCVEILPGASPLRRMTRFEYNNTIRDLLGDDSAPADAFVIEEEALGFNNQAAALGVTQLLAEQLMKASEGIAERAVRDLERLFEGCEPAVQGADVCAAELIERLGKRAFRRPLTPAEVERFARLFAWGNDEHDLSTGVSVVIQAMLQSPHFLYRVEHGMPDPDARGVAPLSDHEIASRLSYLLWSSMPDDALFAAADAGELHTAEQIAAQARRLLEDPRARAAVANFHAQWLGLSHIDALNKDPAVYPRFREGLGSLLRAETEAFLDHVVFEDDAGDVATLLSAPYSLMNAELRAFYGLEAAGGTGAAGAFEVVPLDPSQRAGVLTHASLLSVHAKPDQSSPIHRGKFVRERLLCQTLPPPPADVDIQPPEVRPGVPTRRQFEQHAADPNCAGCHRLMDPIGFGFEHYDGIGLYREVDQGVPVDASGEIRGSRETDGHFDGAVELAHKLAQSDEVRSCVATQWFRFGYGRAEQAEDECSMAQIQEAFAESGYNIKELLVALTQTDAFRYRRAATEGREGREGREGSAP